MATLVAVVEADEPTASPGRFTSWRGEREGRIGWHKIVGTLLAEQISPHLFSDGTLSFLHHGGKP